jgi:hypothetical protein
VNNTCVCAPGEPLSDLCVCAYVSQGKYGIMEVAIKVVSLKDISEAQRQQVQDSFASEVSILVHMRHPHIIRYHRWAAAVLSLSVCI